MIPVDLQGMSPKPAIVLEGEVSGPRYGATTAAEDPAAGLPSDTQDVGVSSVVAGENIQPPVVEQEPREAATLEAPSMGQQGAGTALPVGSEAPAALGSFGSGSASTSQMVYTQVGQRVEVGGMEFSPPEDFPSNSAQQGTGAQNLWIMRLGEFVQRRVSQAGAMMTPILESRHARTPNQVATPPARQPRLFTPEAEHAMAQWARRAPHLHTPEPPARPAEVSSSSGSLSQEQLLAEVKRQVQREMRVHDEQNQNLIQENQQLRTMLQKVLGEMSARGLGGQGEEDGRGTSGGPQGTEAAPPADRDGNPPGLRLPSSGDGGIPFGPQPDGPRVTFPQHAGDPPGQREGATGFCGDPLGVRGRDLGCGPLGPGEWGGDPSAPVAGESRGHDSAHGGPSTARSPIDPMGALMQGMAQLQNAMSQSLSSKAKEPEQVKPGVAELPKLAELSSNSAIDVGDWLHGLQNHMGDLSNGSSAWWKEILKCLVAYYVVYMSSSHVGKLAVKPEAYESEELRDVRWARVDKRAAAMILGSVPETVKSEARVNGTLPMLARIIVLYRPSSVAERQQILKALEAPGTAANAVDAVNELRKWSRWMSRATDMGLQPPDASVLIKGLDQLVKVVLTENQDIAFRVSMLRYNMEVDTRPTVKGAKDLHQALMSELEQVAYRSRPGSSSAPFVKAATALPSTRPSATPPADGGASVGSPKAKAKPNCRFYLTDKGCSRGSACTFSHNFTRKEKAGRCWTCGSTQHQQNACPTKAGGTSPTAKPGGAPGPKQSSIVASATVTNAAGSEGTAVTTGGTTSSTTTALPTEPTTGSTTSSLPEGELKSLLQEASAMLKEIRQLKMMALSSTQVENQAVGHKCNPMDGRTGLLDSGASHPFREATEEELCDADLVRVQLADGKEVVLGQGPSGTLLTRKSGSNASGPIVPLGALVQDLGCQVSWTRRGGLVIRHPEHGVIRPMLQGRCPVVAEAQALDLIREIECEKLRDLQRATRATARSLWLWDVEKPWAKHLEDFVKTGSRASQLQALSVEGSPFASWTALERSVISEAISLDDKSGWTFLRAMPGSRQRRKRLMTTPWVLHLFSGPGKSLDPVFRELDDGRVLVQVDINRSKAEDLSMVAGVYRALLWAAATGRIDGIIGSPPNKPELVQKMMWLSVVSKAARAVHGGHPVFVLMESQKVMKLARNPGVDKWSSVSSSWDAFMEAACLEEVGPNVVTNLNLEDPVPLATGSDLAWTVEFKRAIASSATRWGREPDALQVVKWMKKLDAEQGKFLEGFTDKELQMWRTHVRNNHLPFNRRCGTCVRSSATGRAHRRVRHPSAHCLSLDVAGPFRQRAADPNHNDYRYLLVGAYLMPRPPDVPPPSKEPPKEPLDVLPPSEEPLDVLPPSKEPLDVLPPSEEPLDVLPPSKEPLDVLPPSVEPPSESLDALQSESDDTGCGVGKVDPGAGFSVLDPFVDDHDDPHPMQEAPEGRVREVPDDDTSELRGLSQEEFERIYDEVGQELDYETVYVVRPMRTRTAAEVMAAVQELVLKLRAEGLHISRVHSDRARELRVEPLRRWLLERGALSTYTEGQAPQSNGRAEAAVKWVKTAVKRLLESSGLGKENWAVAANYAAQEQMEKVLRRSSPMLPFGTKVHVRSKVYGTGGRYDLDSRWKAGRYVGPSLEVRGGHLIRFENRAYMTSTHLRPYLREPDQMFDLDEYEVTLPVPARRLRTKLGAKDLELPDDAGDGPPNYDPEHPAEQFALRLLEEERLTPDQLEILALMLPSNAPLPKRFGPQAEAQKMWISGAFVHGGIVGVKNATSAFPASTKALVKYVKQLQPDHKFNAVAVSVNVEAQQHVDAHNVGNNLIAGLSYFKGGALEVEEPTGVKILPLDGDQTHQLFNPKYKHSTRPWYGGTRVVLVAYSVRDSGKLGEARTSYLREFGFDWDPHLSRPDEPQEPPVSALKAMRVGLMDASQPDRNDHALRPGADRGDQYEAHPEQPADANRGLDGGSKNSSAHYMTHDLELAIGDLEDRAARLRDLLEEEEILSEEYRRMGQETRVHLTDTRDQVSEFLEYVHQELVGLERVKLMACVMSARTPAEGAGEEEIDYEALLEGLEEDLKVVHTVPTAQVKQYLSRWTEAIRKEVEALFSSGTLRRVTIEEARRLESTKQVIFAPAKCVFTLKPPQVVGKKARRKCRLVICGNFVKDNQCFGDLYAAGTSTDALRLSLVIAAIRQWVAGISDITGAFLLATWPENLPKYGIYPPRVVRDAGITGNEAWIVERPLYGLRESPRIWNTYRNDRLRKARVCVGDLVLILRPTVSEPELWTVLCEVTGTMHGLIVLYVDDIAYFSTEPIVKALHAFIIEEWPASDLEWVNDLEPVRYLGMEIQTDSRVGSDGVARRVFTVGQSAYVKDVLMSYGLEGCHTTQLPVPREWIEQAENDDEPEPDIDEEAIRKAQKIVGELLWLATKTRPDLLFTTSHMAMTLAKKPAYVSRVGQRVLTYLAGSADLRLTLGPTEEVPNELICFTDASYAPYGRRSFGAAVVTLAGCPIAWKAGRQSFITLSVMEAELYAATQGCTLLSSIHALLDEVCPGRFVRILAVDNQSAVSMCAGGPGSQRTRHLKIRANYVRESVENGTLVVRHVPGDLQLADLATKVQPKLRLQRLLQLWGFVGFATEWIKELKLKLMMILVTIAQCVCPARGAELESKDPLPTTGWDELLLVCLVVSVFAVIAWEGVRWAYRECKRWQKRVRRAKKLEDVGRLAAGAARREIAEETTYASYPYAAWNSADFYVQDTCDSTGVSVETVYAYGISEYYYISKEMTGCMKEQKLHEIEREMKRGLALETRRRQVALELQSRGQLTEERKKDLLEAGTAEDLDDIWAPFQHAEGAGMDLGMGPQDLQLLATLLEDSARHGEEVCESPAEAAARILKLCGLEVNLAASSPCTPPKSGAQEMSPKGEEARAEELSTPAKGPKRRRFPSAVEEIPAAEQKDDLPNEAREMRESP
ncbi:GIP [Symbiodinium sp. CCMP2592]|nr:GIP [Symbiodinium sp. CCMP2592]